MDARNFTQTHENNTETSASVGAELTQPSSPTVLAFDPEATRRFLMAERVLAGAKSPMGHRCSNLIEQIKSYQSAPAAAQASYLEALIRRSVAEIQALKDRRLIGAPQSLTLQ